MLFLGCDKSNGNILNSKISIKSSKGHFVSADKNNDRLLISNRSDLGNWEIFFIEKFDNNKVTSCIDRFKMARMIENIDETLLMGGATNNWVLESLKAGEKIFKKRKKLKNHSVLMFQAGNEYFSKYERQNKICNTIKDCKNVFIRDSFHEMFHERNKIRDRVISETLTFLRK